MHAYLVSVQYTDLLSITLPYNRHHFSRVTVVTTPEDYPNLHELVSKYQAEVVVTNLFTANGATFNKWAALEYAMDVHGRDGWLCLMDADVLWPKDIMIRPQYETVKIHPVTGATYYLDRGQLCTPLRRMFEDTSKPIPPESEWGKYPVHRNVNEWAGYSQIFHGSDPVLGNPPWHETDWIHAGGADSFFQAKWPAHRKLRPQWECLHIGKTGENWMGRCTPYMDGTVPEGAQERLERIDKMWRDRRGKIGPERFRSEKIG